MLSYGRILRLKNGLSNIPLISLLAANTLPLIGVLFFGWDAFLIVLLYWAENLVIGFYNILKMAFAKVPHPAMHLGKLFMIPFFMIHYGGFIAGHGFFILMMFKEGAVDPFPKDPTWPCFLVFLQLLINVIHELWSFIPFNMLFAIAGLFISHGISFTYNYLHKHEFQEKDLRALMAEPYGRIMIMHVAIIAGGFLTMSMGSPIGVLVMLVILKTIFDVKLHLREHRKKNQGS